MKNWKKLLLGSMAVGTLGFLAACGDGGTDKETGDASESDTAADTEEVVAGDSSLGVSFYQYAGTCISSVRKASEGVAGEDWEVQLQLNDAQGDQATQNDQLDILIE